MTATPSPSFTHITGLYQAHHGWLQGWLRKRLGNAHEAADLAQDTFVRLMTSTASPVESVREARPYLATVAKRLMLDHLRRQSLEQAYLQALTLQPEPLAPSAEQQVAILQALQEVDAMLHALPDKVRAVFILSQVEGLSYTAIACELGLSLRTVKRHMARAMAECIVLAN
ncbi:sigma-70 family RNA polymerase sigma factor [Lampropedia puyangensis]|uniref:Sigma-70 family RNA polymerase sigma factor n=1 Tax=Lampropedia puyangensis TaxID=1330072 RepID=A0A4S8FBZ3_9BURK|nr:sigma-70 family RNA polymerase sigma factor [Lampropedia puyangensis]THU05090.1 sigma-70 family RNA polymerase sigma factor [Lampropedia puyangensis]